MAKRIDLKQGSEEWLAWRTEGVGASEIAAAMGICPYMTPAMLWAEKVGLREREGLMGNPHVRRGKAFEEEGRRLFETQTGLFAMPICLEDEERPYLRASLDGSFSGGVLEIKVPGEKKWEGIDAWCEKQDPEIFDKDGGCYVSRHDLHAMELGYYYPQVQQQLLVAGKSKAILGLYNADEKRIVLFYISVDEAFQAELVEKVDAFWGLVQREESPELDPTRDVVDAFAADSGIDSETWVTAEADWLARDKEIKALESKIRTLKKGRDDARDQMVDLMGENLKARGEIVSVTISSRRGSVDYNKAITDLLGDEVDLEPYRKAGTKTVTVTALKKEKSRKAA